jgi:hypothetical protein
MNGMIIKAGFHRAFYRDGIVRGGNFHRQWTLRKALALLNEQRQCPLPVKPFGFPRRKTLNALWQGGFS